jgi:hypothetical protein
MFGDDLYERVGADYNFYKSNAEAAAVCDRRIALAQEEEK